MMNFKTYEGWICKKHPQFYSYYKNDICVECYKEFLENV